MNVLMSAQTVPGMHAELSHSRKIVTQMHIISLLVDASKTELLPDSLQRPMFPRSSGCS